MYLFSPFWSRSKEENQIITQNKIARKQSLPTGNRMEREQFTWVSTETPWGWTMGSENTWRPTNTQARGCSPRADCWVKTGVSVLCQSFPCPHFRRSSEAILRSLHSLLSEGKCLFPSKLKQSSHRWSAQPQQLPTQPQTYDTSNMFWGSAWDWAKVSPILTPPDLFPSTGLLLILFMIHN